jgi:uncharacterized protein YbbK (DUF523 family)
VIIVSACLAGINCRYDGGNSSSSKIREMVKQGKALPVCPEQLGGLPTPRVPSEIIGGDGKDVLAGSAGVINLAGENVTAEYIRGAFEALNIAKLVSAEKAVLKEKSPACGCRIICRGDSYVSGMGVCAAVFVNAGIKIEPA